jgi:hypothetical protein
MLTALVVVAIPILIHLLNRQRATIVDWGAMRFLMESLTSRSRRILIEEIILMALRCLIFALLVLAMAQPFLPARTTIPWVLVAPAIIVAAILAGIAAAVWSSIRARWALLALAGLLTLGAVGASAVEAVLQQRQWSLTGGERDVAILIDGSSSMTVPVDGRPNFQRAVEEALTVLQACRPADAVSLIVAGSAPRPIIPNPITDREELTKALADLRPTGGSMRVIESLGAATASLAEGPNPAKKIVLITDGQSLGWDARNEARWKFLAAGFEAFTLPPTIVCRTLDLPKNLRNVAVADIRFSRKVVGTDRPVRIDVTLSNTGDASVPPLSVELTVDGASVARQDCGEMVAGAAETVRFDHRFLEAGPHIVAARVLSEDEMPGDNVATRVLPVIDKLPVLLIDGDPSSRPLDGAAAFLEIALTPLEDPADDAAPKKKEDDAVPESDLGSLVTPTVVALPDIATVEDFGRYTLVILANVARLPQATAGRLAAYVQGGGGLLIVAGDKAQPDFYASWTSEGGRPFVPAALGQRKNLPDSPAHLGVKTFSHPALTLVGDSTQSDAERALVTSYWPLDVDQKDQNVRVGGLLDTGDPLLVERRVGDGYVLMTALGMDRRDSNLPSLKCYVPLVHEMAYYLAAPALGQTNVAAGSEFVLPLPPRTAEATKKAAGFAKVAAEVLTPDEMRVPATLSLTAGGLAVTFSKTYQPGLYRVTVPATINEDFVVPASATAKGYPFVVLDDAEEGRMVPLSDADIEAAGLHVDLFRAQTTGELVSAVTGNVPGEPMWEVLALALLVALLAEIGLTRWIASQRRMHMVDTVTFGPTAVDAESFRDRAKAMVNTPNPEGAAKES